MVQQHHEKRKDFNYSGNMVRSLRFIVPLALLAAVVGLIALTVDSCRPSKAEYERESMRILNELPAYPGTEFAGIRTEKNHCDMILCWRWRSYYSYATYDTMDANVAGATDCSAAEAVADHYASRAPARWTSSTESFPMTWPNGREGCAKIVSMRRRGIKVYVNVASSETGGLGQITISVSH